MPVRSAGILLWRRRGDGLEVWLAHMGGPFWAKKDEGAWSVVKGEFDPDENAFAAARREFAEETGQPAPDVAYDELGEFRQPSGKLITVFAGESDTAPDPVVSNTFALEWPPRSGRMREFPEIDDARWFSLADARAKIVKGQRAILDALAARLAGG
ncbi:NUDIX domain-containing protein [Herbiconiux daphne]|uniref:NUDIX domain-containing protein n=1 Tax=Herbiconiux daphne TaxID=2970914 RepID=A0ABT2H496_9MICO|nr:NUDIX domain-containing protein [Herbiconiux daphne]MCS5734750.1 NUDIX domain-containing protein [Herbiconiux daphne]